MQEILSKIEKGERIGAREFYYKLTGISDNNKFGCWFRTTFKNRTRTMPEGIAWDEMSNYRIGSKKDYWICAAEAKKICDKKGLKLQPPVVKSHNCPVDFIIEFNGNINDLSTFFADIVTAIDKNPSKNIHFRMGQNLKGNNYAN